jgi:tRNA/rRNA methyltransferase
MATQIPPAVILVRPTEAGNIGSVARAMANTGLEELIIVEPAVQIGRTARAFAVGATPILDRSHRYGSLADAIEPFQQLIGTSSQRSRAPRVPLLTPRQLAASFSSNPQPRTALVFGPERTGLTTDELAHCSLLVRIPASPQQPTLNLAQAVLIVAHELFVARLQTTNDGRQPDRASLGDVEGFLTHLREVLTLVGFNRDDTFASVFRDLRRLTARADLRPREVTILRGILRRTEHQLNHHPESSGNGNDKLPLP